MKQKNIVLGLFANRIDILLCHGDHVASARRVAVSLDTEAGAWFKSIKDAGHALKAVVAEMNAVGAAATVLYRNATACAEYTSLSVRSATEAREAAILGCAESLSCSLDDATCAATVIGRDSSGDDRQTHVVIAADHDQAILAISEMVQKAGLVFKSATPIDAVSMARLCEASLHTSDSNKAYLYVGESRSFLVIADNGSLLFARTIGLGTEALATSLARPIRNSTAAEPIELNFEVATDILHRFGFPSREQVVHEQTGLTGTHIIPLLQPVLQRFIVELRQSLRFGVQEDHRQSIELTVTGPGSAIPNFASLIAAELRLTSATDNRYAEYDYRQPDSVGSEMRDVLDSRRLLSRLELVPKRIARVRHTNRLRRWLWTGAAASLAVIGMDAMHYHNRLADLRNQVAAVEGQATDIKALQSTGEKLFAVIGAVEKLETSIANETGASVNIRACLHELSHTVPKSIRLTAITFHLDRDQITGRISGYAFDSLANTGRTELEPFVEQLKDSPLFAQVVLSNVQASDRPDVARQQFEVNFNGVGIPRELQSGAVAVAAGDSTQ